MNSWDALAVLAIHAGATVSYATAADGVETMTVTGGAPEVVGAVVTLANELGGEVTE